MTKNYRIKLYVLKFLILIPSFLAPIFSLAQSTAELNAPEKIFFNAKIFTSNIQKPYADAIAIKGKKIVGVGNLAQIKKSVGPNAIMINMHGGTLLPGFIDSHNHAIEGGETLLQANVYDSMLSVAELISYVDTCIQTKFGFSGDVLVIKGLNISTWSSLKDLMATFNGGNYENIPILFAGSDGHTGWSNSALQKKAGINSAFISSLDAEGKKYFGIESNGSPNGFIADSGFVKLDAVIPASKIDRNKVAVKAMEYNNSCGITAWLDPAAGDIGYKGKNLMLESYKYLAEKKLLTAHIAATVVADANGDPQKQINSLKILRTKYNSIPNIYVIGFKIFADGVIEYPTQTAALSKPYTNSGSMGILMYDPKKFSAFVIAADKSGLLVHVHAIGDRAVTETLNGFEAARKTNGNTQIPHTITHVQVMKEEDISRFANLGILASLQLYWAMSDVTTIDIVKPYIDPTLYQLQYPARSLLHAGVKICGASDWPVSTANPFYAIYEAETRRGKKGVLDSSQTVPRLAMLYAYTINAACALREEKKIGSLEVGKSADIIFPDRDVLMVDAEELKNTKINWTMFEGKIVYSSSK
ncbi:MAG: amidohydrolase [Bacteroidetes bacterium]|nr:MAG: amidohydrolase [Bacteroidota bacterium]